MSKNTRQKHIDAWCDMAFSALAVIVHPTTSEKTKIKVAAETIQLCPEKISSKYKKKFERATGEKL